MYTRKSFVSYALVRTTCCYRLPSWWSLSKSPFLLLLPHIQAPAAPHSDSYDPSAKSLPWLLRPQWPSPTTQLPPASTATVPHCEVSHFLCTSSPAYCRSRGASGSPQYPPSAFPSLWLPAPHLSSLGLVFVSLICTARELSKTRSNWLLLLQGLAKTHRGDSGWPKGCISPQVFLFDSHGMLC